MRQIERITLKKQTAQIPQDLEKYRQKALEMGATQAKVIPVQEITVDDRVTLKCQIPRCFGYGAGAHCPPYTLKPAELREALQHYQWAVLFIKEVPPEVIVRDKATIKERVAVYQEVFKIVSELESMAFYDGHYLAFGLGAMLAGLSGAALVQVLSWVPNIGAVASARSFVVIVLGGMGSLPGAMVGGIIIGIVESLGVGCFPDVGRALAYQQVFGMIIFAIVLLLKPTGLFGREL